MFDCKRISLCLLFSDEMEGDWIHLCYIMKARRPLIAQLVN